MADSAWDEMLLAELVVPSGPRRQWSVEIWLLDVGFRFNLQDVFDIALSRVT